MWKVGQRLVCVNANEVAKDEEIRMAPMPKLGEIVTSDGPSFDDGVYIKEYNYDVWYGRISFWAWRFRPVEYRRDADTDELIRQFTVTETLDAPFVPQIKKPQTA